MKKQFCLFLSFAALSCAFAAEKPWQKANKARDEFVKQKLSCEKIIDELEKMRADPEFATNAYTRAYIDKMIIGQCRRPGWTGLARWNINLEQRIPSVARRGLDDPEVDYPQKIDLAGFLAEYYAGEKCWADAEKVIRTALGGKGSHSPSDEARGHLALADVFRWQDRFEDAWKEIEIAAPLDPNAVARKAYALAEADGQYERADAIADMIANPGMRFEVWKSASRVNERTKKIAMDYVKATTNDINTRASIALGWFAGSLTPDTAAAFDALKDIDRAKLNLSYPLDGPINNFYWHADWKGVEAIFGAFAGTRHLSDPRHQRIRLFSLAADGRKDDALAVIATNLVRDTLSPLDKAKFEVSKALLTGGDPEKVIAGAKLERKDEIALVLYAARNALVWEINDAAERLTAKHASYFVDFGQRAMKVPYTKTPIESIADWRKIFDKLDPQICDRKFGANLDALETDVATGRKAVEKTERDSADAQMEISAVSDVNGLHIFLHVEDPAARAVQNGFAGGIGTEMYFAPGKYEPYICFGSNPRKGIDFAFQTKYNCKDHKCIDMLGLKDKHAFRFESSFTDTDYVQHLFFAWDTFYQKMPVDGAKWRFECLAFGPKGPFSLGGSENVHNSSKWCDLVLQLGKDDITAIRRGMLYRAVKGWRQLGRLDRFDKWADAEIGDPEFYGEVLKPIEKELQDYAKTVKPDMADADVNLVFEKALPRWLGIAHEIDELRRNWLQDRLCK